MVDTKKVQAVDAETGEAFDYAVVAIAQKAQCVYGKRWFQMSQDALMQLAEIKSTDQLRVLLALMSRLDFENLIAIDQTQVAKSLGMHRQHVNRAIAALIQKEILLKGPKIGLARTYRLNPSYGWKGRAKGHREALRERMEAKGLSVVKTT